MNQDRQPHPVLIAGGLSLASPWRRLAAYLLDTLVLLLWNALVFLVVIALAPESAERAPLPFIAMVSALAYLWVGWALYGMTLGKWALGIRVIAADGRRLSWLRALARVPAFLAASAPLKIGFLAALWDRRRQGWHDHLAGTLVVAAGSRAAGADGAAQHVSTPAAEGEPAPAGGAPPFWPGRPPTSSSGRSRFIAAAMLAVYLVVAVGLTLPLALNFSTHIPGAQVEGLEQDAYVFLWDYWWVRKAARDPALEVMSTRYLFWPQEISLRYQTMVLLHSAAAALLQSLLSLIQAYNLLLLLSLAASAWGAFLLARYITGSTLAGAVAGLAFGFCPYMTTHALAHQNLIAAEWLAPFAYFGLRALRERRARYGVGAGASWALVGLCDWYYFLYAGMLLAILLAVEVAARPRRWAGALVVTAGVSALTVGALWPLLIPMLLERAQAGYVQQPLARAAALGGQPGLYLIPAFTHPLFGGAASRLLRLLGVSRAEGTLYLGLAVMALALIGVAYRGRQLIPWISGAAFFLLLALGPYLRLGGITQFNAFALLLLGGPPGNGFDLPVTADLSSRLAMGLVGGGNFLAGQERIVLPYLWLWKYVPLTRLAAVPTRAVLPGMLCLVVLAAGGLAALMPGLRRRARLAIAAIAATLVVFDFLPAPYPLRDLSVPKFYHELARRPGIFAVAEAPLLGDYAVFMYYQTVHHKPLLAGLVSRQPPQALAFVRGNRLLRELQPERTARAGEPVLLLTRAGALERSPDQLRAAYLPALRDAENEQVKLILAHAPMLTGTDIEALDRVLHDALGLAAVQEGDGVIAYYRPDTSRSR